jgi:Uma2 family endonuclease
LGIPEYWLIDPQQQMVTLLQLRDAVYVEFVFREQDPIRSTQFPDLVLTAEQILSAGE